MASIFLSFSLLLCSVLAAPSPSTGNACKALASALPKGLHYQDSDEYKEQMADYWSAAIQGVTPACIITPHNAQQVSTVVKTLGQFPDVDWAVKSGGHDPNPGHSAVQDGIVVSMHGMMGVTYDNQTKLAGVLPGGHWQQVITPLDKQGVTTTGARLNAVGVGGYLSMGGISFLSAQYGLAADNVVAYETVFPNGTIANVTQESNKDLMTAMRGGAGQFGIHTRYVMRTYPIGKVWGGYRIYGEDMGERIFAGLHAFVHNNERDPKAAIIVNSGGPTAYMVFFFYDGPQPPKDAFAALDDIPAMIGFLTTTRSYTDLLDFNSQGVDMLARRTSFRSIMLPYLEDRPKFYREIEQKWKGIAAPIFKADPAAMCVLAFQPFPHLIGKQSIKRGGNAMGLTASDPNRFNLEISCQWGSKVNGTLDDEVYARSRQFTDELRAEVTNMKIVNAQGNIYLPEFMNDASWDQDVFGTYKDSDKFRVLQKQIDPSGMFLKRLGGFSYTGAPKQRAPVKGS